MPNDEAFFQQVSRAHTQIKHYCHANVRAFSAFSASSLGANRNLRRAKGKSEVWDDPVLGCKISNCTLLIRQRLCLSCEYQQTFFLEMNITPSVCVLHLRRCVKAAGEIFTLTEKALPHIQPRCIVFHLAESSGRQTSWSSFSHKK